MGQDARVQVPSAGPTPVAPPARHVVAIRAGRVGTHLADLLYLLPIVVLIAGVMLLPSGVAVFRSVFDWHPGGASPFVGLANFIKLAQSDPFHQILANEGFFLLGVPLWTLLPLALALVLYEHVPAAGVFRTIFFFPSILSPAILGILFRGLLAPDGLVNAMLRQIGLGWLAHEWIDSPSLVKPVLIVVLAWSGLGVGVVIFSAALGSIAPELFEAAALDGASWWQRLRYVMLPGIRSTVELYVVFQILSVFLFLFGWIYVVTQGGPGYSSTTIDYDIYQNALNYGIFGTAAAESVYLLVMVLLILSLGVWLQRRRAAHLAQDAPSNQHSMPVPRLIAVAIRRGGSYLILPRPRWSRPSWLQRRGRHPLHAGRWTKRHGSLGRLTILVVAAIPFVYPFYFMAATALKTQTDYVHDTLGPPVHLTLTNLTYAWTESTPNLGRAMVNSLIAVSIGVLVVLFLAASGAYWFRRHQGRLAKVLMNVLLSAWLFPFVIWIVPLFVLISRLRLTDNLIVLGILYGVLNAPFGLYLMHTQYKDGIPPELPEAAAVDGASTWQQFRYIYLPLSRPALSTLAALSFVWSWGDLLVAVVMLQDASHYTLTVAATTLVSRFDAAIQQQAAAALISVAPLLVVFLGAQRAIVRGFTAGIGK